ncbi:MAG: PAS domain S-box protein [Rhodothermales bacterium]
MHVLVVGDSRMAGEVVDAMSQAGHLVAAAGSLDGIEQANPLDCDLVVIVDLPDAAGLVDTALGVAHSRVCLAFGSLSEQFSNVDAIDDLFYSVDHLVQRLPFIERRVGIRDIRQREYAALFETTVDGIIIIDSKGIIQSYNRAAASIFGYEAEEVIGRNVSMLMPNPHREQHDEYVNNYLRTGQARIIGIGREVNGLRKDGTTFPMDLAVSEVRKHGDVFFTGVVRDITERRRLESEILRISEQERRRIGQDLHDGLGQMLTGIGLITQNLARQMEAQGSALAGDLFEITQLVRDADQLARNLARGLVQVELEGDGLLAALRILCKNAERMFDVSITLESQGDLSLDDSGMASNLYRIAQEAISNAVKHGRASRISVRLAKKGHAVELAVEDDGVGFPKKLSADRGMGVDIMGYRARVIGGSLSIRSRPSGGTAVKCVVSSYS